ncbi:uncharacterized protein LOC135466311 [Liolophura sinensis]|uniref:uncharacterized protein LOC135466311 n=1 Tax=Liolophura sinensis TaxID=3198878 RepID=UPI003157F60F
MLEPRSVLTDLKTERRSLCENQEVETDEKLFSVASDEEDELIQYLTGEKTEFVPPCLKLIPKPTSENSNNFSPIQTDSDGQSLCMSKNAIAARETRQRKKQYLGTLENTVKNLRSENVNLKNETKRMKSHISELNEEVCYLRSVLANQSVLAGLLQNIQNTPGVRFRSSLIQNQGGQKMEPKKPTAAVTGMVKSKPSKRKREDYSSRGRVTDSFDKVKMANLDHGYAAEPKGVFENRNIGKSDAEYVENADPDDKVDGCLSENPISGGICLHVSNGSVSFEFCAECSKKALCGQ